MLEKLPSLQKLINQLRHVPYLASKNVYRVALHLLTAERESVEKLCEAIWKAKDHVRRCSSCGSWAEDTDQCAICSNPRRDKSVICVVESWPDLFAVERSGQFSGVYHLLGGALCPLEGVGPDQLRIKELVARAQSDEVTEVIFATNPTPEGEATVTYLMSKLPTQGVSYSRLASGVPTGGMLAYMDRTTINKALSGRRPV